MILNYCLQIHFEHTLFHYESLGGMVLLVFVAVEMAFEAENDALQVQNLAARTNVLERSFSNLSQASGGLVFSLNDMNTLCNDRSIF